MPKKAKNHEISMFFDKRVRSSMSRAAITLKFKMSCLLEKRKKTATTTTTTKTKAKENRLKCLQADIKTLTYFTL